MGFLSKIFSSVFKLVGIDLQPQAQEEGIAGIDFTAPATDAAIPVIYGDVRRSAGTIIFRTTNDVDRDSIKNDLLHLIIVWGEANGAMVEQLYIDDEPITSSKFSAKKGRWAYAQHIQGHVYSDPILVKSGWAPEYNKPEKLLYSYVRLEMSGAEQIFSSRPKITADISQKRIYDVRTRTYTSVTSNPALQLYDYLTNARYGKGLTAHDIDLNSFKRAATECDLLVDSYLGGNKVPLYTSNIQLDTKKSVKSNCEKLLAAMRASLPVVDGKLSLVLDDNRPAIAWELDEDTIVGDIDIQEAAKRERYNQVTVQYYDDTKHGKMQDAVFPSKDSETEQQWLNEDNGIRLNKTFKIVTLNNVHEAMRLAEFIARKSRDQLKIQLTARDDAALLVIGDVINVTNDVVGFLKKPFMLTDMALSPSGEVRLSLVEHQPSHYSWKEGVATKPIPDTVYKTRNPNAPSMLKAEISTDNTLRISWESALSDFDYKVLTDGKVIKYGDATQNHIKLVLDAGSYDIEVKAINALGHKSDAAILSFELALPAQPTVSFDKINHDSVTLSGSVDGSGLATTFEWVFLGTDDAPLQKPTVKADVFTYTGLSPETTYKFKCRTVNPSGHSQWVTEQVTTRSAHEVFAEYGISLPNAEYKGAFELTQVPHWTGKPDAWVPSNLTNKCAYEVYFEGLLIARKSFTVTLKPESGALIFNPVTEPNDVEFEDILMSVVGVQTSALMVEVSYLDKLTSYQSFSSSGLTVELPDFEAVKADLSDLQSQVHDEFSEVDELVNAVLDDVVNQEENFTYTINKTLDLQQQSDLSQSSLSDLAVVVADNDMASSLKVQQLTSEVESNQANLKQYYFTKSDTESAIATSVNTLAATVDGNQANLVQSYYTKANTDEVVAASINQLTVKVDSNQAKLVDEYYTKATADEAIAAAVTELEAVVDDNKANLQQAYYTKADTDQVVSQSALQLSAQIDSNLAYLNNTFYTEAQTDSVVATSVNTLKAQVNETQQATIDQINQVKAQGDGTQSAVAQLVVELADTDQALSAVSSNLARVDRDVNGNYQALNQLTTRMGNAEGGLSSANLQLSTHQSDIGTLTSRAHLGVDHNNRITGINIKGSNSASQIDLLADSVRFLNKSGSPAVYWSNAQSRYVFDGEIVARKLVIGGTDVYNREQLKGDPGRNGQDGRNGQNGSNGIDGKDGTNGRNGTDGKDGANGRNGTDGIDGKNGSAFIRGTRGTATNANFAYDAKRQPVYKDVYITSNGEAYEYTHTGSWIPISAFIDGSMLVSGSVTADSIRTHSISTTQGSVYIPNIRKTMTSDFRVLDDNQVYDSASAIFKSENGYGLIGYSANRDGVRGLSKDDDGVKGSTLGSTSGASGVRGEGPRYGVYGHTSSSGGYGLYSSGNTKVTGNLTVKNTVYPFTAGHEGLIPRSQAKQLLEGELLVRSQLVSRHTVSNTSFVLKINALYQNRNCFGVFNSWREIDPEEDLGFDTDFDAFIASNAEHDWVIAGCNSIGEGLIRVCGHGGDINPGDNLCASAELGLAQKQGDDVMYSHTVATCTELEPIIFESEAEIKTISVVYRIG